MRQMLRHFLRGWADFLRDRLPHWPIMAWFGLFHSARSTRRFLTGICAGTLGAGMPVAAPKRRRDPARIWFLADVFWEQDELIPELQKIGETVVTDFSSFRGEPTPREEIVRIVEQASEKIEADLILLYAREGFLSDGLFQLLRTKNAPIWGMNLDDKLDFFPDQLQPRHFRDGYCRWTAHFDLNLTSCRVMPPYYAANGGNAVFFPEGFRLRPEFLQPRPPIVDRVSFVGSWRRSRADLIRHVRDYGFPVQVYGRGWPDGRAVTDPSQVYRSSQISLGDGVSAEIGTTNLKARDFETTGANACYLTTYNWELAEQFEVGREILCYRNADELVEMLVYYRDKPEECARIAQAGFERACADHTWEKRFRRVMADWY